MKNIFFVVSCYGCRSEKLLNILNNNSRVMVSRFSGIHYKNWNSLEQLVNRPHKNHTSAAFYGDQILFNEHFSYPPFYKKCKFIFFIDNSKSLNSIVKYLKYTPQNALSYYCFRLRRIYEMAKRVEESVFLTFSHLREGKGLGLIEKLLNLRELLKTEENLADDQYEMLESIPSEIFTKAEDCYEKYYFRIRQLPGVLSSN